MICGQGVCCNSEKYSSFIFHITLMKRLLLLFLFLAPIVLQAQIISTIAGNGHATYGGDSGHATDASLNYFAGISLDELGNLYIADGDNQRIRKVDAITGIITTIAGNGIAGYTGDNMPATSTELNNPDYIVYDKLDNAIIFSDFTNSRLRKIVLSSGIITTICGTGSLGFSGDGGPATAASIYYASGVAIDNNHNILFADVGNGKIRKIDNSGIITTIGGNGTLGYSGDGGLATNASFGASLTGICTDILGNVYIADGANHRVREIQISTGMITTIGGNGSGIYSGDGIQATNAGIGPCDVFSDRFGNLLVADFSNNRIRKIDRYGTISTIVANGTRAFSGDGGVATSAEISGPEGVREDSCGNIYIYIADFGNVRVRKVTYPICGYLGSPIFIENLLSIYPNPTSNLLQIDNMPTPTNYNLYNIVGATLQHGTLKAGNNSISLSALPTGMYLLELIDDEGNRVVRKIIKE